MQHFACLAGFVGRHARCRFVQQQQLGFDADCHGDFEPLLLPVGKDARGCFIFATQVREVEHFLDRRAKALAVPVFLKCDLKVLTH